MNKPIVADVSAHLSDIISHLLLKEEAVGKAWLCAARFSASRETLLDGLADRAGCLTLLKALPAGSISRLVSAPVLGQLIATGDNESDAGRQLLRDWIEAEHCLLNRIRPDEYVEWTALGDYRLNRDGQIAYAAPRLRGIAIDGFSPFATSGLYLPLSQRERIRPPNDIRLCAAKINKAFQLIDRIAPAGSELISIALRALALYDDPGCRFGTSSSRRHPGVAALANVAAPDISHYSIADALLHEATHSALYFAELDAPFFLNADTETPRVISPWTGTDLPLHGFVHACCVWFELSLFWDEVLEQSDHPDYEADALFQKAAAGFFSTGLVEAITAVREHITPFAFHLLNELRTIALDRLGHPAMVGGTSLTARQGA
ncbi:hypothetical protein HB780_00605 (plasmid) [Rhizobium lusitanum]|uniref:aKG-HExxH-type peptide beta-hydroxylase n=1 Tax=Rhizobium lusitanum TaxID=293958 RepID=UPI001616DB1D|nr:HEXXH motif-containing putative peptide modification protein [Rhizobium lusitanum]QND44352.1 hypothetical protein HB780_00605 [Rhizobium lusitanum]